MMQIETAKIRNGDMVGESVWICHFNRPDLHKKALRNVPPTKVVIVSNSELPKNKTVYYSNSHFRPISKSGKVLAKIISPVDNTGYRSYIGNELFVFDNEHDCYAEYYKQVKECISRVQEQIKSSASYWVNQKEDLQALISS